MDETSPPPAPPIPAPERKPTSRGISATTAALLGAAIGIVGSMSTTVLAAHYTSKDHAADRADARAKDKRAALATTYVTALKVARRYADVASRMKPGQPRPPIDIDLEKDAQEADALVALTGSRDASLQFYRVLFHAQILQGIAAEVLRGSAAPKAVEDGKSVVLDAYMKFEQEARADIDRQ